MIRQIAIFVFQGLALFIFMGQHKFRIDMYLLRLQREYNFMVRPR